jgi:hypothetical protein
LHRQLRRVLHCEVNDDRSKPVPAKLDDKPQAKMPFRLSDYDREKNNRHAQHAFDTVQ